MKHRRHSSGALEHHVTCVTTCLDCGHSSRRFLSLRRILKMVVGEEKCGECDGQFSITGVDR